MLDSSAANISISRRGNELDRRRVNRDHVDDGDNGKMDDHITLDTHYSGSSSSVGTISEQSHICARTYYNFIATLAVANTFRRESQTRTVTQKNVDGMTSSSSCTAALTCVMTTQPEK